MTDHRYQWMDAEWFTDGSTVSKASITSFKIATDVTERYHENRRAKIFDTTTKYATITSSSYSAPDTTINLQFDGSGSLGASFTAVALSILSATNSAIPRGDDLSLNFIIGGNFDTNPWQRQTSFAAAANAYTADRFAWLQSGAGVVTVQKTADAPTAAQADIYSINCLDVSTTTADASIAAGDFYTIYQAIEGYNFAQLAQQPFTLSFWVKSTITGIFCVGFKNSVPDRSYVAEYTINTTNTWEYKTITVTASPSAGTWDYTTGAGLYVQFCISAGSTFQTTANTWATGNYFATSNQVNGMSSNTNHFKIQFVQIEAGQKASLFELETIDQTLLKCQRYYEKSYVPTSYPAAGTAVNEFAGAFFNGLVNSVNEVTVPFKVPKRVTSTGTVYASTSGTSTKVSDSTPADVSATITNGQKSMSVGWTNSGGKYGGKFQWTSEAEL